MKYPVSLEHQIMLARKNKKLKAQKDRLLDACRDLVSNPSDQKALDKARKAIELGND